MMKRYKPSTIENYPFVKLKLIHDILVEHTRLLADIKGSITPNTSLDDQVVGRLIRDRRACTSLLEAARNYREAGGTYSAFYRRKSLYRKKHLINLSRVKEIFARDHY